MYIGQIHFFFFNASLKRSVLKMDNIHLVIHVTTKHEGCLHGRSKEIGGDLGFLVLQLSLRDLRELGDAVNRSLNDLYIRRFYTTMRWKRAKSWYLCYSYLGMTHLSSHRIYKNPTERISSGGCCRRLTLLERINRWNHRPPVYVTYEVKEHLNFHHFTAPSDKCIMFCSIDRHNCTPNRSF